MFRMKLLAMTPKALVPVVNSMLLSTGSEFEEIMKTKKNADTSALDSVIEQTENVGWSVNRLVVTIILIAMVIGGIIAGAKLFFATPQERQEQKIGLLWKALAVVGVAAVPALILVLTGVGENLFPGN